MVCLQNKIQAVVFLFFIFLNESPPSGNIKIHKQHLMFTVVLKRLSDRSEVANH